MSKKEEVLAFLRSNVFDPILNSPVASDALKQSVRHKLMRMEELDAAGIISFYWFGIVGTNGTTKVGRSMKAEGFTRFEEIIEDFHRHFNVDWLESTAPNDGARSDTRSPSKLEGSI